MLSLICLAATEIGEIFFYEITRKMNCHGYRLSGDKCSSLFAPQQEQRGKYFYEIKRK
jgi:hypothetical protein